MYTVRSMIFNLNHKMKILHFISNKKNLYLKWIGSGVGRN